ncbi:MAG TPA: T9SS type A sorting domain-containing protein [Flavipsychrobacter sp.]|nr:T9SS type A sorting domain-containing protein [Flavipsychrobacter sp.]
MRFYMLTASTLLLGISSLKAQEEVAPLDHNTQFYHSFPKKNPQKPTANTLPFFEDFTLADVFPDNSKWMDHTVYINNTMGQNTISRGVATFDALNALGGPYDSINAFSLVYADSLTSQPFNLASYQPGDSLYLSFFYQPQGNGFAPETQDSLLLFLKKTNDRWTRVWAMEGKTVQKFSQVMVPVTDVDYFHNSFQFRFVNKASINVNDDVWNVDYIRFAANRNMNDTTVQDVAATAPPSNILNDYTSLPYRHFTANKTGELSSQTSFTTLNNYGLTQIVNYSYAARETVTNTSLFTGTNSTTNLPAHVSQSFQFPMYAANFSPSTPDSKVIFENKYWATTAISEPKENDTIVHQQIFDNYLAYDDGTAEKSYFLKQYVTLPAKLAIEYHLNQPDTLRGFAVYFGRQVPLASGKFFNVEVFRDIAFNGGTDDLVYDESLFFPAYADTVNHFWTYKFETPVVLPKGAFYLSLMQPANSGSDSLYYGLDVNRQGSNHAYYNVLGTWQSSAVSGAVMIRPILGHDIIGTKVNDPLSEENNFTLFPNPASEELYINAKTRSDLIQYRITDMQGRVMAAEKLSANRNISIRHLNNGVYFLRIFTGSTYSKPQKFIKQ